MSAPEARREPLFKFEGAASQHGLPSSPLHLLVVDCSSQLIELYSISHTHLQLRRYFYTSFLPPSQRKSDGRRRAQLTR